ncbi:hypothetical protein VOLCADRAFT_86240 [Volvox carteri f. nagariensis]|uniref:SET domain-containing protein n=1 Tax=Volvox carteri f. nagariensis TaxID=3068 RepID=D8TI94_VOLCA|nr:uncharacterized protein VOLCADRAFT_86240 [Volvox carteri f. nagariensis]EFJ53202.1 hypothetical protein VOLCADRAFT_86240 [Volvox carteri f. nagariensis]|eukprot:XP_002946207.1 hypothetical protein VOLCADRAFT_86240 [Volvox carteri f. nagariensis]
MRGWHTSNFNLGLDLPQLAAEKPPPMVFHSRCFYEPGSRLHMCVPGVDLANHSPRPSAEVRLQHSPAACQGYEALAEVAEPPPPEPSRFNLLAGEGGIRCGDEVTISYGCWPSNSGSNTSICPGEILTLFGDAEEAVRWSLAAAAAAEPVDDKQQQQLQLAGKDGSDEAKKVEAILRDVEALMPGEAFYNLAITSEGVDGRLQVVLQAASQHLGLNPRDFLRRRVQERLAQFENVDGNSFDGAIGCFVRSKRALAQCILTQL